MKVVYALPLVMLAITYLEQHVEASKSSHDATQVLQASRRGATEAAFPKKNKKKKSTKNEEPKEVVAAKPVVAPSPPAEPETVEVKNTIEYVEKNGDNLPYPGIDALGLGYSLVHGNPAGDPFTQMDPGFRAPVVELVWDQNLVSRDVRDLTPVGGYAFPETTCYQNQNSKETSSAEEYSSSLSVDASVSAGGGFGPVSGSFSASAGFNSFQNDVVNTNSKRFSITSYCLAYKAGLSTEFGHEFTPVAPLKDSFAYVLAQPESSCVDEDEAECAEMVKNDGCDSKEAEMKCPMSCQLDDCTCGASTAKMCHFFKLFDKFGTHWLDSVELGGKMIYEATITESSMETLREEGISASVAVEVEAFGNGGGAGVGMSSSSKSGKSSSNADMETTIKVFGGIPPTAGANTDEGFSEWAETIADLPMPVRYTMTPMWKLPAFSDMKSQMINATNEYMAFHAANPEVYAATAGVQQKGVAANPKAFLKVGQSLKEGESLSSGDGAVTLKLNDNGSLRLVAGLTELWKTGSPGTQYGPYKMVVQGDANIVVYDKDNKARWASGTHDCKKCVAGKLKLQDDGNLVLYADGTRKPIWNTGTHGPKRDGSSQGHRNGECC